MHAIMPWHGRLCLAASKLMRCGLHHATLDYLQYQIDHKIRLNLVDTILTLVRMPRSLRGPAILAVPYCPAYAHVLAFICSGSGSAQSPHATAC